MESYKNQLKSRGSGGCGGSISARTIMILKIAIHPKKTDPRDPRDPRINTNKGV
jgi:hypothetical protein